MSNHVLQYMNYNNINNTTASTDLEWSLVLKSDLVGISRSIVSALLIDGYEG